MLDVTVMLALLSAMSVGTSDFVGGLASRRTAAIAVTTVSHLAGAVVAVCLALVITGDPTTSDMVWGAVAGVSGAVGIMSIYAGYAKASVAIAGPVAGVGTAALPAIVDTFTGGERLPAVAIVGVVLGLAAIGMVSRGSSDGARRVRSSLLYGLGGAVGLGFLLLGLAQAGEDSGMWPLTAARLSGFVALAVVMASGGRTPIVSRDAIVFVLAIAVLNTGGNALFVLATRAGSVTVAAVITSLFPAVTVLWAWRVFRERLVVTQVVGLCLGLVAIALIMLA